MHTHENVLVLKRTNIVE